MKKSQVVHEIYEKLDINKKDVNLIVNRFFSIVKEKIKENHTIELRRFATFGTRNYKYNDSKTPYFKASKRLKYLVSLKK